MEDRKMQHQLRVGTVVVASTAVASTILKQRRQRARVHLQNVRQRPRIRELWERILSVEFTAHLLIRRARLHPTTFHDL